MLVPDEDWKNEWDRSLLKALFDDVYFTRLWIVQEIILSKDINILCRGTVGAWHLPWKTLNVLNRRLRLTKGQSKALIRMQGSPLGRPLIQCLESFGSGCCFDPRDQIYVLLGL